MDSATDALAGGCVTLGAVDGWGWVGMGGDGWKICVYVFWGKMS
jgi:hypothetical protein